MEKIVKIVLLTSRVLANGQTQQWGDIVEVDRAEAHRLITRGQAKPANPKEK